jgi:hypothetical protein
MKQNPISVTYNYPPDDFNNGYYEVKCPCGRKSEIYLPEKSKENWTKVDEMNIKDSEAEIREIANQVSFFLGKHNTSLDNLKRLYQKFYDLEDCMKGILWDEEVKRRNK